MDSMNKIKELFSNRRLLEGSIKLFQAEFEGHEELASFQSFQQYKYNCHAVAFMDILLHIVTEEEAFVIQTHIIDGLDWPCVIAEHLKRWGPECIKTDRTFKSYNRHALQKMANFCERNTDKLWTGVLQPTDEYQNV